MGLVAPSVINEGIIQAKLGRVQLSSGDTVTVNFHHDDLLQVAVHDEDIEQQLVSNSGTLSAQGGTVAMTAAAATQTINALIMAGGVVEANTVARGENGAIIIKAEGSNKTDKAGDSRVTVSGRLDASGRDEGQQGGVIEVLGDHIAIADNALIDARGHSATDYAKATDGSSATLRADKSIDNGVRSEAEFLAHNNRAGGSIKIGGDYLGKGETQTAKTVNVEAGAVILNDALENGDGGRTIIWSDDTTEYAGVTLARGGASGGHGGFLETSGKINLKAHGEVDLGNRAAGYGLGTYLLDPATLTILNRTATAGANQRTTAQIEADAASANVVLTADGVIFNLTGDTLTVTGERALTVIASNGNILDDSAGTITSEDGDISLTAAGSINLDSTNLTGTGDGWLHLTANENIDLANGEFTTDGGSVVITSNSNNNSGFIRLVGSTVTTDGGNFIAGGGQNPATSDYAWGNAAIGAGVTINNTTITTGAGDIVIRGQGRDDDATLDDLYGVHMLGSAALAVTTGNITLTGMGGDGNDSNYGVNLEGTIRSTAAGSDAGTITITGTGGDGSDGSDGGGSDDNTGVFISSLETVNADVNITGTAGRGTSNSGGVRISTIRSTGTGDNAGNIIINGQTSTDSSSGVYMVENSAITTVDGDLSITTASNSDGWGLHNPSGDSAQIQTTNGDLTITSTSTNRHGIYLLGASSYIRSIGSGDVTIMSTITEGANDVAVWIDRGTISSMTGNISIMTDIEPLLATSLNYGVGLINGADVTSTTGDIFIAGDSTGNNTLGLWVEHAGTFIGGGNTSGDITLRINNYSLNSSTQIRTSASITIQPFDIDTKTVYISSSATPPPNQLNINLRLRQRLSASRYIFGRSDGTGDVEFPIGINWGGSRNLTLQTGTGSIIVNALQSNLSNFTASTNGTFSLNNRISAGTINISAGNNIELGSQGRLTATQSLTDNVIQLSAGGDFINNYGAGALETQDTSYWIVYSDSPVDNRRGGVLPHESLFGQANIAAAISNKTAGRNAFAYQTSARPTLTYTAMGASVVYGQPYTGGATSIIYTGGLVGGDILADIGQMGSPGLAVETHNYSPGDDVGEISNAFTSRNSTLSNPLGYTYQFVSANLTVTPAPLTLTASDASRIYGDANPSFNVTPEGLVNNERLDDVISGLTISTTASEDSDVGTYNITPAGATATNYAIRFVDGELTINQKPIDFTTIGRTVTTKTYDAKTAATLGGTAPAFEAGAILFSDEVTLVSPSTGTFADKNAGANKMVTVSGYSLSGAKAGNYALSRTSHNDLRGEITRKEISFDATGFVVQTKTYNGNTEAQLMGTTPSLVAGSVESDDAGTADNLMLIVPSTGMFDSANAGQNKDVSVTFSLSGTDRGNYTLQNSQRTLTGEVEQASLTLTANDASRVYGDPNPSFDVTPEGLVNNESLDDVITGLSITTTASEDSDVGTYAITPEGATATNYDIRFVDGELEITPAPPPSTTTPTPTVFTLTRATTLAGLSEQESNDDNMTAQPLNSGFDNTANNDIVPPMDDSDVSNDYDTDTDTMVDNYQRSISQQLGIHFETLETLNSNISQLFCNSGSATGTEQGCKNLFTLIDLQPLSP